MSLLEKDAEKARSIIEEEKITAREEKLEWYIKDIEQIFKSTPPDYPKDIFMERGIQFVRKSFPSTIVTIPSIDLVISLGILDQIKNNANAGFNAWIRAEYYAKDHTTGDNPKVSREYMIGEHKIGIKKDEIFNFFPTSDIQNGQIDDALEYINEAIRAIRPE